jgi:putative lipoic acid-binding regulatory protein
MNSEKKTEEFYKNLKEKLSNDTLWPSDYLYKFIVPTDEEKVSQIKSAFEGMNANIQTKASSKGNFTSVSVHLKMKNPDAVIEKYLEVSHIKGIISL